MLRDLNPIVVGRLWRLSVDPRWPRHGCCATRMIHEQNGDRLESGYLTGASIICSPNRVRCGGRAGPWPDHAPRRVSAQAYGNPVPCFCAGTGRCRLLSRPVIIDGAVGDGRQPGARILSRAVNPPRHSPIFAGSVAHIRVSHQARDERRVNASRLSIRKWFKRRCAAVFPRCLPRRQCPKPSW